MDFYSFLLSRQNRQHASAQQSVKILYSKSSHNPFSCKPWKQWNPYSVEGPQYHFCPFRCTSVVVVVWTNSWVNLVLISRHTILFFPCLCWPAPFLQIRSYLTYLSLKQNPNYPSSFDSELIIFFTVLKYWALRVDSIFLGRVPVKGLNIRIESRAPIGRKKRERTYKLSCRVVYIDPIKIFAKMVQIFIQTDLLKSKGRRKTGEA